MKYMLLMTGTKAGFEDYAHWSKEDLQANMAFMRTFSKELKDSGVYVSTEGLGFPHQAKTVRAGDGGEPITDGVFPETKEFLAGFWIVDVENAGQAYQIAARLSGGPGPGGVRGSMPVEVRRVLDRAEDPRA
jgi:hypothetical protein